jgi:hypothetical protein
MLAVSMGCGAETAELNKFFNEQVAVAVKVWCVLYVGVRTIADLLGMCLSRPCG